MISTIMDCSLVAATFGRALGDAGKRLLQVTSLILYTSITRLLDCFTMASSFADKSPALNRNLGSRRPKANRNWVGFILAMWSGQRQDLPEWLRTQGPMR